LTLLASSPNCPVTDDPDTMTENSLDDDIRPKHSTEPTEVPGFEAASANENFINALYEDVEEIYIRLPTSFLQGCIAQVWKIGKSTVQSELDLTVRGLRAFNDAHEILQRSIASTSAVTDY
jgi:hypothetical protein